MKRKLVKVLIITALVTSVSMNFIAPVVMASEVSEEVLVEEKQTKSKEEIIPGDSMEVLEKKPESQVKEEVKEELKEEIRSEIKNTNEVKAKDNNVVESKAEYIPIEAWKDNRVLIEEVCSKTGVDDISKVTYEDIKRVKMLDLKWSFGEIPEIIGEFENLVVLDITSNYIGKVPEGISKLTKLKELNLSNTNIGDLPEWIGNLKELEYINLAANNFRIFPGELLSLPNIKYIELSSNNISDIPSEIGILNNLISLDLSYNNIGDLPEELYSLNNLRYLGLNKNSMREIPIGLTNMIKLEDVSLRENSIIEIPKEIINIQGDKTIFTLDVTLNQIVNIPEVTNRQKIIYDNNFLPSRLYNIPTGNELRIVNHSLSINKGEMVDYYDLRNSVQGFTINSPMESKTFPIDERLELEMVLNGKVITPEEVSQLEEGVYKIKVKLASAAMDNPSAITKGTLNLVIGEGEIDPDIKDPIKDPDIPENATGFIPIEYWQECTPLMMNVVGQLGIRDISFVTYEDLAQIEYLILTDQELDDLPKIVEKFTELKEIHLDKNNFSDIPEELFKLKQLNYVSLSFNKFTEVPENISKLENLETLFFAENLLYGNNIKALTNMKKLKNLYLSNCRLTNISELSNMNGLEFLNVEGNQLVAIPKVGDLPVKQINLDKNFIKSKSTSENYKQFYVGKGMVMEFNKGSEFDGKIFNLLSSARYYNVMGEEVREDINIYHDFEFIVNGKIVSPQELTNMEPGEYNVQVKLVGADINNTAAIAKNEIKVKIVGESNPSVDKVDPSNPVVKPPVEEELNKLPYTGGMSSMATILLGGSLVGAGLVIRRKKK